MDTSTFFTLPNGIRVVHYPAASPIAHCGLLINAGARDEAGKKEGIAHFIEHMLFKGTVSRRPVHILSRIDEVGGELNAYTTKENTFIYASFPCEYIDRSMDVIADISFNSVFPEKEIEKERAVITDEIQSYKDDPSEEIGDEFDAQIFNGHILGAPILGTVKSVASIRKKDILSFIGETYNTDEMVLCYIGNTPPAAFRRMAEKYFGPVRSNYRDFRRKRFASYKPVSVVHEKDAHSTHCMMGNIAYGIRSPKRLPLFLLNNVLGGPGLNSRLNMGIREKYGYTYFLESSYTAFDDTGMWSIYFATDRSNQEKTMMLVEKELRKLRETALGTVQLQKAKMQLKGQLAMANENNASMLHVAARSFLLFNRMDTVEQINRKIDKITASELLEVANEVFDDKQLSKLVYTTKK